jgi:hypothetical protein
MFGKTALLYGDPNRTYTTEIAINSRKYYLSLYKNGEDQVRHKVMSSKDLADKYKTEEFVKEVMDEYVEHCKTLYIEYEQHERDTHKTVITYKDVKYINTVTGEVEARWDLYMNPLPT